MDQRKARGGGWVEGVFFFFFEEKKSEWDSLTTLAVFLLCFDLFKIFLVRTPEETDTTYFSVWFLRVLKKKH